MKTALYRHFNAEGELLYVGISLSAVSRLSDHSRQAGWAKSIAHVTVEWLESRAEAVAAERQAIIDERPKHNTVHNNAVRSGRVPAGGRRRPPAIPMLVDQPEAVAVYFRVSVGSIQRAIKNGMPRQQIGPKKFIYDLEEIKAWMRLNAETYKERLEAKRSGREVTVEEMFAALSKIGATH